MNAYKCSRCSALIQLAAEQINHGEVKPGAITVGGSTVWLEKPDAATEAHEWEHVLQSAEECPRALQWVPSVRARAWFGAPWFDPLYIAEDKANGYWNNKYENAARAVEARVRASMVAA